MFPFLQIYARDAKRNADDKCQVIVSDCRSFGVGANIKTTLIDKNGDVCCIFNSIHIYYHYHNITLTNTHRDTNSMTQIYTTQ